MIHFIKVLIVTVIFSLLIALFLSLRPAVEIIYPQGSYTILVQSMYGTSESEPSLEMLDDWKYGKNYLHSGGMDTRRIPFRGNPNDELMLHWSLRLGKFNRDKVIENGEALEGGLFIRRSSIDFCRLKIFVDSRGKIIRQEKQGGVCFS